MQTTHSLPFSAATLAAARRCSSWLQCFLVAGETSPGRLKVLEMRCWVVKLVMSEPGFCLDGAPKHLGQTRCGQRVGSEQQSRRRLQTLARCISEHAERQDRGLPEAAADPSHQRCVPAPSVQVIIGTHPVSSTHRACLSHQLNPW